MTDLHILNTFKALEQPAKDFINDLKKTKNTLTELKLQLNLAIDSLEIGIEESIKALSKYPSVIPLATIEILKQDKNLITDKIFNTGIILTELNSYHDYEKVYRKVNNMEPSTDDETMQTKALNNNLDKGEANE